ncbi:uncharacterized protein LOC130752919 isoform X1 [Actinidia eriantha]|uniref:uncharacterized protein LOC130752919 isoform X1 n=1 Tax=Actinidia eriantha TaxID=165200 RepID=UPI00258EBC9F|nr:uncharacterized protein LOC130752919 isoform X1 [Actinidia eriantha]
MLVANSFDLWQKDTFFSAAEEVQQSADIMESAYRRWEKENREALTSEGLDELCRELQTALGTAKWQLEEFEKAVRLSYRHRADDFAMARHRQFVEAIESQISRVETSLRESFSEQGKQTLRWVNLNEDECNDLASFLSGTSQNRKDESAKHRASPNSSFHQENNCSQKKGCHSSTKGISYHTKGSKNVLSSNKDAKYVIEIEAIEAHGTRDDITCQADRTQGTRRTWSSPDIGAWKIVIADEDERNNGLELSIEATPKDKGSKPIFSRERSGDRPEAKGGVLSHFQFRGIRWINQILGQVPGGCQRQQQTPLHVKLSSVQVKLALMLFILLIVPFVLYST